MPIGRERQEVYFVDSTSVNITVGDTSSVRNEISEGRNTYSPANKAVRKDRRKNKRDRRRSVREGIFVSLSVEDNRRVVRDRRKKKF
jgi:hypothetical protein